MAGSTFGTVVEAESRGDGREAEAIGADSPGNAGVPGADDEQPQLEVRTDPSGASVYLDGRLRGTTPLEVDGLESGRYQLRVDRDGYYPVRRWIEIDAESTLLLEIDLERITGFLDVSVTPVDATVRVDGRALDDGFAELPIGRYEVVAERFGFRADRRSVTVEEREVTRVEIELERAPFEVSDLSAWRGRFNPGNPGRTGTTLISYRVSAPGSGTLTIEDDTGTVVRRVDDGPYRTWEQEYRWDGTDSAGEPVRDGSYLVRLEAIGDDGRVETDSTLVVVDRSIVVRYRSLWSAGPGLLYAPTLTPLPGGQAQFSTLLAGIVGPAGDSLVGRFPGRIGGRFGLGANLELSVYGGFLASTEPTADRVTAGGALSWSAPALPLGDALLSAGVLVGGDYRSPTVDGLYAGPDTHAAAPGFFGSLPLSLRMGSLALVLVPEYRLAVAPVTYAPDLPANAWTSIVYLRPGVVADIGSVTLGVSAALRSTPLTGPAAAQPAIQTPVQAGAEVHWIVPGSSVVLSGFAAGEFERADAFYLMGGLGVGVLF